MELNKEANSTQYKQDTRLFVHRKLYLYTHDMPRIKQQCTLARATATDRGFEMCRFAFMQLSDRATSATCLHRVQQGESGWDAATYNTNKTKRSFCVL